jgi:hypothetical protein
MKDVVNQNGQRRTLVKARRKTNTVRLTDKEKTLMQTAADRVGESCAEFLRKSIHLRAIQVLRAGHESMIEN